MANTKRNTARLQALAAAVLFSTGGAGIKVESFTASQVSMVRSGVAAAALLLLMRGRIHATRGVLGAGVIYAAVLTLFVAATKLTTAANAIFLQSTAPLYLLILAPLLLQERIRGRDVAYLAAIAGGMGLCFLGRPAAVATAPNPLAGNLLGAASGLMWALTLLALRKLSQDDEAGGRTVGTVVVGNVVASIGAAPFALPLPAAPIGEWAILIYLGVFQIGLAYVFLTAAIRRLPALEVSLLLLLEPVLNPVWTWLTRGEHPGRWTIAGGAVIVAATAARVVYESRRPAASNWTT